MPGSASARQMEKSSFVGSVLREVLCQKGEITSSRLSINSDTLKNHKSRPGRKTVSKCFNLPQKKHKNIYRNIKILNTGQGKTYHVCHITKDYQAGKEIGKQGPI